MPLVSQSQRCIELPGVRCKRVRNLAVTAALAIAYRRSEPWAAARAFIQHARRLIA